VELIERRGHAKIKGERIPLLENTVVEEALQQHGILYFDDLLHKSTTVIDDEDAAATFGIVQKFVWPPRLAEFKTRFEHTVLKDGKDYSNKGKAIQEYIAQVL
jgi:large subunit ribosomal protein L7e